MPNRRMNLAYIKDPSKRKVTLSKRKKGVIKKIIELSILCDLDIFMVIFDKNKQSLCQLNSDKDFDHRVISHMLESTTRE